MGVAFILIKMELFMMENGKMIHKLEVAFKNGKMDQFTQASSKIARNMDEVTISGPTVSSIKVTGSTAS